MLIIFFLIIIIDLCYLLSIKNIYNNMIYDIQQSYIQPKFISIFLCYIFLSFGLYHFIIKQNKEPIEAFILGIVIYGVFDTTNYSIFDKWNKYLSIIDTLWGGILLYITTYIYYELNKCNII